MVSSTSGFQNTRLGRYQLQDKIGSGGMARVYKALDTNLNRIVAVKVLHEHLTDDPTFKERFAQEARIVASFSHPNIVQIFDFDSVERDNALNFYMVMPYISGKTLAHILEEQRQKDEKLPPDRVLQIMQDLAAALDYAHQRGMVHRDIKPGNILFDEYNRAILTDFGIARLAQNSKLTQEGLTVGTPAYMSPEQAAGEAVDARSDIYALGIILYELLTNYPPFRDDGSLSVLLKHVNAPIPSLSQFLPMPDENLDAVVFRALAKNPAERYQSAGALVKDLEKALHGEHITPPKLVATTFRPAVDAPTVFQPLSSGDQTPIPRRNQNSPLGILAVGMTVIAALLAFGLLSQQPTSPQPNTTRMDSSGDADSMTGAFYFKSDFNAEDALNSRWQTESTPDITREFSPNGQYILSDRRPRTATTSLFDPIYTYENIVITMNAMLSPNSSPASGYGIVFRYQDNDNYNVFAVDGLGRYSIWVREDGRWRELRNTNEQWTPNDAIHPLGQNNTLSLVINGDQVSGYVNETPIVTVQEQTFTEGAIGIYMATTSQGQTTVIVEDYTVEEALPATDAMTDESSDAMTDEGN